MKKTTLVTILIFLYIRLISQQYIVVGDTLSSNITYNNIIDTVVPFIAKGSFSVDLDIDNDGTNDLRFYRSHASSPSFGEIKIGIYCLDSIQFIRTLTNSGDCDTLVIFDTINSQSNWNSGFSYGNLFYSFSGIPAPWGPGSYGSGVCTKNNTYIGFRKINSNDTIYGWVLIDLQNSYKIRSYAINKILNSTGLSKNMKVEELLVYPIPSSDYINVRFINHHFISHPPSLYNIQGKKVNVSISFNSNDSFIMDVNNLSNGIYYVLIPTTTNGNLIKKIVIAH